MLKAPPLISSDLHFSVIKCHCRTYDDNIGPKLKKLSFAILGVYNIFKIDCVLYSDNLALSMCLTYLLLLAI